MCITLHVTFQQKGNARIILKLFQIDIISKYLLVKAVFVQYNTGLPSRASVERLFSLGGQVLIPRHNRPIDDNFEMHLIAAVKYRHLFCSPISRSRLIVIWNLLTPCQQTSSLSLVPNPPPP